MASFKLKRVLRINICVLFITLMLFAADDADSVVPEGVVINPNQPVITEADFLRLALARNQKLRAVSTNVAIAQLRSNASTFPNPELRISELSARNYKRDFDELRVGVRFRLPDLGEVKLDQQKAAVDLKEEEYDAWLYRQDLVQTLRWEFWEVFLADKMRELAEMRVNLESARLAIIERMVNIGQRSIVYFTKAKMRHADSRHELSLAIQNQLAARQKLFKRAALAVDSPIAEPNYDEFNRDVEDWIALAYQNRPELKLLEQQMQLATAIYCRERLRNLPWFNFIELNYHVEANSRADWGELALGIEFPLFNWHRPGQKAAQLALNKKDQQQASVKEQIEYQVRNAYQKYQQLQLDYQVFEKQSQLLITDADKVIDEAKRHQTLLADEVYEMELACIDLQELLLKKRSELVEALFELLKVVGIIDQDLQPQ